MEQITNLYELKAHLKKDYPDFKDMEACLKFIETNCELVDDNELLEDYFGYILPLQLSTESQSNEYSRKMSAKANAVIDKWKSNGDETDFKNIQVKVKEEKRKCQMLNV